MSPIALIKTGGTIARIKLKFGDFEDWFVAGLGVTGVLQVDVFKQQQLPDIHDLTGILITGSAAMVSDREDWSERTAKWLQRAVPTGIPVLGVCYGHQLLAHALGGRVGPNPNGRQMGTVTTNLLESSANDPLLGHLPSSFAAQSSHLEIVLEPPPEARRLASTPLDHNFAIRFAENVWGVQFHPEFSGPVMLEYIRLRSEILNREGLDSEQLLADTTDTAEALTVLRKFAELVRLSDRNNH